MTLPLNPPPLEIPAKIARDGDVSGFFDDMIRTLYQLWAEVSGAEFSAKTKTTDATNTALQRVGVSNNRSVMIEARAIARRTGGSSGSAGDSAGYVIRGVFKNISGTVSLVGSVSSIFTAEDQSGWNLGFSISGTEVIVTATGAANNNITWESAIRIYEVGV